MSLLNSIGFKESENKATIAPKRRKPKGFLDRITLAGDQLAFNWKIREGLYRHLAAQVGNGVPVEIALSKFRSRLQRRKRVTSDKIVADVARKMKNGSSLATALGQWIPEDEKGIISSGDLSGNLPRSLELLAESKRRIAQVRRAFKSAVVSPLIYAIAVYAVLWVIGSQVIPSLQLVLPKEHAHGLAYALYVSGDLANSLWAILPPLTVATLIGLIVYSLPRWTGKYRVIAENYFPFSFYRDIHGYTWVMTFTALLGAGMTDVKILKFQSEQANPWLKERLYTLWWRMENGTSLSDSLLSKGKNGMPAFGFPNPDIVDDITSLADFPDFPVKMGILAAQWAKELEADSLARALAAGFWMEMFMYAVMGLLMVAVNSMSSQLGTGPVAF